MLDLQAWIERVFAKWTYRELVSALALVAIAVAIASYFAPNGTVNYWGLSEMQRWLSRDDARAFRTLPKQDGHFTVAWIGGSPMIVRQAPPKYRIDGKTDYAMSDVLSRNVTSMDGKPVTVQEFSMLGAREGDFRRAVLYASQQPEIDAYILEANPVSILNDFLQFTISRQRPAILNSWPVMTWFDVKEMAAMLSPHEIGLQLLSFIPAVRNRYDAFHGITFGKEPPFPFTKAPAPPTDVRPSRIWKKRFPDMLPGKIPKEIDRSLRPYRDGLFYGNLSQSGTGMKTFAANLKTLAATGKPTVIWMPPINPAFKKDPRTLKFVGMMKAALDKAFKRDGAKNIVFDSSTVWAEPTPTVWRDNIHVSIAQGEVDMVTRLLEKAIGEKFVRRPLGDVYDKVAEPAAPRDQEATVAAPAAE